MKKHLLLAILMLLPLVASADTVEIDGIYYYLNSGDTNIASVTSKPSGEYSGEVIIPESVTYEEITYNVTSVGGLAFSNCKGLTSVTIPNSVRSIGSHAFLDCSSLTSVTISNSLTSIGEFSFSGCSSLPSITIPSGVTHIGECAFACCSSLTAVHITDLAAWCKLSFKDKDYNPLSVAHHLFLNDEEIKDLVIPDGIIKINSCLFEGATDFKTVSIPNSVTSIGYRTFLGCSGLTSVTIPNTVTSIGDLAFCACNGLMSVTSLATTPPQANEGAFAKFDIPLYVPKGTRDAYLSASPWNMFKEIIEIDNSIDDTDVDEIIIKDIGKTTWCSEYDLDFTNVAGIKAYIAIGYDDIDKTIWLARVMKVPAGMGLLVKGDAGTYKIPHSSVRAYYTNMFKGNLGETIQISETDGNMTNYYLSGKDGSFVSVNSDANIGKNKAYLQLPTSIFAGTRTVGISYDDEDGTTGIKEVKNGEVKSEKWFTLQGQRVDNPGKGIYIRNRSKIVIR